MPTSYTSSLGLALPATGELTGTWGDTVNDYITKYVDASVAGTQTISGSQTAVTLSTTTGSTLSQAGSGATGSSQYQIINCTGNPGGLLTITAPATSKTYIVLNATSTNQQVKLVGTGPTTGVTLDAGERAVVAWNGSDFAKVASSVVDGVASISFGTTGLTPSTATSGAVTVAGTLAVGSGGTGATTFTANNVLLGNGTSAFQTVAPGASGNLLVSDGTTWTSQASSFASISGNNAFTGANTFYNATGQTFGTATAAQDGIILAGRAGGTGTFRVTLSPGTLTASRAVTFPDAAGVIVLDGATQTLSAKTLTNPTVTNYTETPVTANTGTAYTIDTTNGTLQILTLTGNCVFTFPTPTSGKSFMLLLRQDATGNRTVTWPATVRWPGGTAPTITATASRTDKYVFTADGTRWYGTSGSQNYTA